MTDRIELSTQAATLQDVEHVARLGCEVAIGSDAGERIGVSRDVVTQVVGGGDAVYGINTGFGALSSVRISPDDLNALQVNLVRSHAAGVGEPLATDVVRAMMFLLAASLSRGHSGVREDVVELLVGMLNRGVTPIVPSRGSVGASGDLAPLAHLALVMIGEGEAIVHEEALPGAEALRLAGLEPITLEAKEGLALINGTHLMCAIGALALIDVARLQRAALVATAMAIDACRASHAFLDDRVHAVRQQPGQRMIARALRRMLAGSQIVESHREDDPRVQDPYSLRCAPQVLGAVTDLIEFVRATFENELGAVTDNPLIFPHGDPPTISAGNFHGMPLAIALDSLSLALCHLAGVSERRTFWIMRGDDSENHVPPFLSPEPGLHSGMMIAQYTAAACCNELQTLATPASVGNVTTSAGMEDYNSMGATSAHQVRRAVDLTTSVIAIEFLVMSEGLEYQRPLRSGAIVERVHEIVRQRVPRFTEDRPLSHDIQAIENLIRADAFQALIE